MPGVLTPGFALSPGAPFIPLVGPADVLAAIDLRQVKLAGELGRRIGLTVEGNLLQLDLEKDFLAPFVGETFAGVPDATGHFIGVGKTLDGVILLAAYTGNQPLLARKNYVVETLLKSQESDGYIGLYPPEKRTWMPWDLHEQGFIIHALVNDWRLFGKESSLTAARDLADYIIKRWPGKPVDWEKSMPIREFMAEIGLNYAFILLAEASRDERYLDFAATELWVDKFDLGIVLGRRPPIEGHSYSYLSHCLAQMEMNRLRPNPDLLRATRRAVEFMTEKSGMVITGGVGKDECWTDDQNGCHTLGETCSTAYQTFVFDSLLRMEGRSRWGDIIERMLYNAAFAAESLNGRHLRYYTPFEGKRVYFEPDTFCCPGNFRRLIGYLPQWIYYRAGNGLVVNLYNESEVTLDGIGGTTVTLRQETDYPSTGRVIIYLESEQAATFPLLLRIPAWCAQPRVLVNDDAVVAKPGEFLNLDRTWQRGDKVTLELPMPWRFVAGRKTEAGRAAIMRGPLVYTLNPDKHPALEGIDLQRLVVLPETAELIRNESTVRPAGTGCKIKADTDKADQGALSLTLTEFPDPDGQWIYFQVPRPSVMVEDELLAG